MPELPDVLDHFEPGDLVATACELRHRYDGSRATIPHGTVGVVLDAPAGGRYLLVELSDGDAPRWISPVNLRLIEKGWLSFGEQTPSPSVGLFWDLAAIQAREIHRLRAEMSALLKYETGVNHSVAHADDGS